MIYIILRQFFLITLMIIPFSLFVYAFYIYYLSSENINKLIEYDSPMTTQIFDKKNRLIANLFSDQHRIYISFDDIPIKLVESLLAIEDTDFFDHNGINVDAIIRAIVKDIQHMAFVEGASTLTQQLVKLKLLTREKKLKRKFKEVLLSLKIENHLSKTKILELYLNEIFLGHGYYGVQTASLGYFRKDISKLNLKEIAMLVGIPKSPNRLNPVKYYERNIKRANKVLKRLKTLNWISDEVYQKNLLLRPIVYDDSLSKNKAPYVVDYVKSILQDELINVKQNGYKLYLHIDLDIQKIARESLQYGYNKILEKNEEMRLKKDFNISNDVNNTSLNGSITVMENETGNILALVGGVDYKKSYFNRAHQSKRPIGSSAKPFIYQVALNRGYSLTSKLKDISRTYQYIRNDENLTWRPRNYGRNMSGLMSLEKSLIYSRNLATINLVEDIGLDYLYNRLRFLNFRNLPFDLSISLGSFGASSLDMQEYYSLFSNKGTMVKPNIVSKIENIDGDVFEFEAEFDYKIEDSQAYLITHILKKVVNYGSGKKAYTRGIELAGKTGTTSKNIDVWFSGFSPTIQTVVWYGNDNGQSLGEHHTGGSTAAPAFSYFYKKLLKLQPHIKRRFDIPENVLFDKNKIPYTDISKKIHIKNKIEQRMVF